MTMGVNHITFAVADLVRAVRFYVEVIGCTKVATWKRGAYLRAGDMWLCLSLDAVANGVRDYTHVAFSFDAAGLARFRERLAASGGSEWQANTSEGDSVYFLDPDGHRLEAQVGSLASRTRLPPGVALRRPRAVRRRGALMRAPRTRTSATAAVRLEAPSLRRAEEFLDGVRASRRLHRGWVTPPRDRASFRRFVEGSKSPSRANFLAITADDAIAGVVNVSEIVRGNLKSAYVGYYAFEPHAGRGLLRAAVRLVVARCFGELRLHRLEANIQPANSRSIALARSLGFRYEGLSPRYLKVCGRWRDHERWALLADEWHKHDS